jgi:hypothetical protein
MFLLRPLNTGWSQQSMQAKRKTSMSRPTLLCSDFDIHDRIHCTSKLQSSWIAAVAAGHYSVLLNGIWAILPKPMLSRCYMLLTQCSAISRCMKYLSSLSAGQAWEVCAERWRPELQAPCTHLEAHVA